MATLEEQLAEAVAAEIVDATASIKETLTAMSQRLDKQAQRAENMLTLVGSLEQENAALRKQIAELESRHE
jgi:hypothetical protein